MKYLGGKAKVARHIAPFIDAELLVRGHLVEPFVGGFNLVPSLRCAASAECSDVHAGLIALLKAVQSGAVMPDELSEHEYARLRFVEDWSDPLTAFAAFGCSFGGKEWGGYARGQGSTGPRNYAAESSRLLQTKRRSMAGVVFRCSNYQSLAPASCVVYCDPPYRGTTGYKTGAFDYAAFYAWCEAAARRNCAVFVSEFTAPPHWTVLWSRERKISVSGMKDSLSKTETLYKVTP